MQPKSNLDLTLDAEDGDDRWRRWAERLGRLAKLRLRPWQALGLFVAAVTVGLWLPEHLNVTITPSLGKRVFLMLGKPAADEVLRGDYVIFTESHPWSGVASSRMTKRVACQPGDYLRVTESRDYYCNEDYLGRSLTEDSAGTALPHFVYDGAVPAGHYFLSGGHPRSYDSRYYGLVTHDRFEQKVFPLF